MKRIYLHGKSKWKRPICKIKGHKVRLRFGNFGECTRCGLAPINCQFVDKPTKSELV